MSHNSVCGSIYFKYQCTHTSAAETCHRNNGEGRFELENPQIPISLQDEDNNQVKTFIQGNYEELQACQWTKRKNIISCAFDIFWKPEYLLLKIVRLCSHCKHDSEKITRKKRRSQDEWQIPCGCMKSSGTYTITPLSHAYTHKDTLAHLQTHTLKGRSRGVQLGGQGTEWREVTWQ